MLIESEPARIVICQRCLLRERTCAGVCVCTVSKKNFMEHAQAGDCPEGKFSTEPQAPAEKPCSKGLGDTIAKMIQTATLGTVKPCEPCKQRQATLNRLFPYGSK
jgi:hypothetical protein